MNNKSKMGDHTIHRYIRTMHKISPILSFFIESEKHFYSEIVYTNGINNNLLEVLNNLRNK